MGLGSESVGVDVLVETEVLSVSGVVEAGSVEDAEEGGIDTGGLDGARACERRREPGAVLGRPRGRDLERVRDAERGRLDGRLGWPCWEWISLEDVFCKR